MERVCPWTMHSPCLKVSLLVILVDCLTNIRLTKGLSVPVALFREVPLAGILC